MKFERLIFLLEAQNKYDETPEPEHGDYREFSDADPDFELGKTNFPHGDGYPNSHMFKDYDKVVRIDSISDDDHSEEHQTRRKDYGASVKKHVMHLIKTKYAWLVEWIAKTIGRSVDWVFNDNSADDADYENSVYDILRDFEQDIRYWQQYDENYIKQNEKDNPHWRRRWDRMKAVMKAHPDALDAVGELYKLLEFLYDESPESIHNEANYPLYVTLYDVTRAFGGHHEGGWWYDYNDKIQSYKVKDHAQAEKAAKALFNSIGGADMDGKPLIVLERQPGSLTNNTRPNYE